MARDLAAVRADFPILERRVHGKPLVYLDSAATSQKPRSVLEAMDRYYQQCNANVHRGVYQLAEEATAALEGGRAKVARFLNARKPREVVFTKNATESVNLVAHTWARANLVAGDAVLVSQMEHHANIVPWHQLAAERGIEVRWIPLTAEGTLDLSDLPRLLDGTKLVGVTAMSNVLGTINDLAPVISAAHAEGAVVLVDGAQSVPHLTTDVQALGCDFLVFSAHKMLGPTGLGVLWAREELLDGMPPFLGGGEMITDVRLDGFTPNETPWKFEAGTPPIAEVVGLDAAIDYLSEVGMAQIREHEVALTSYTLDALDEAFGSDIVVFGPRSPRERGGVISFALDDLHAHDVAQVLDEHAVCVRAGHHCAKPLMRLLGVPATARASFYLYNNEDDVELFVKALDAARSFFARA